MKKIQEVKFSKTAFKTDFEAIGSSSFEWLVLLEAVKIAVLLLAAAGRDFLASQRVDEVCFG